MNRVAKIPSTAFEDYLHLGDRRSYQLLANRYNCNKRSITTRASREKWQERILQIQHQSRETALARIGEDDAAVRERQLRIIKAIQARALETLRAKPFETAADATKALLSAQKAERELLHLEVAGNAKDSGRATLQIERTVREVSERRIVTEAAGREN
ncbi:MAG: hypothetical protein ACKVS6_06125 [Planctomycetota bacterium]